MRAQNCWFLPSHTIVRPCMTPLDDQVSMLNQSVSELSGFSCYFHITYSLAIKGNGREGMFEAIRESSLMDADGCVLPLGFWFYFWPSEQDAASPATWFGRTWQEKEKGWRDTRTRTRSCSCVVHVLNKTAVAAELAWCLQAHGYCRQTEEDLIAQEKSTLHSSLNYSYILI